MRAARFERLLRRHGGDLRRWPDDVRAGAERVAAQLPDHVQATWAEMRDLEAALARHRDVMPPMAPERQRATVDAALREIRGASRRCGPGVRRAEPGRVWLAGALASAAVAGLAAGFIVGPAPSFAGAPAFTLLLGGPEDLL